MGLRKKYTVEELRNYSSAKEFIEQTRFWQDTSQEIAGYTYKQIVDAWLAEMETWQGHWDYYLYGDEHFKYFYGNTNIHKPGYGAGNTFEGFSYVVDQINVTHEPQYEYTVTKPGTVTITVEGTQRQDGYGIANLVGKKTVQIQVKAKTSSGWRKRYGSWYYYNDYNEMQTGWQKIDGKWYYMNGSGAMLTGWQKIGGKWYYMNGSGVMVTGWLKLGSKWYYMNGSGVMVTGRQKIGGKWYQFNASGVWIK